MSDWDNFLKNLDLTDKKGELAEYLDGGKELRDLKQMDVEDFVEMMDEITLTEEQKDAFREKRSEKSLATILQEKKENKMKIWVAQIRKAVDDHLNDICPNKWPQINLNQTSEERHREVQNQDTGGPLAHFKDIIVNQLNNKLVEYIQAKNRSSEENVMIIKMLGYLFILIRVLNIVGTPANFRQLTSITGLNDRVIGLFDEISGNLHPDRFFRQPTQRYTPLLEGITELIDRVIEGETLDETNEKLLELIDQQKEALEERKLSWAARKQRSADSISPEAMQTAMAKMPWASFKPSLRGGCKKKRKSKKRKTKKRRSKKRRSKKRKTYRRRN